MVIKFGRIGEIKLEHLGYFSFENWDIFLQQWFDIFRFYAFFLSFHQGLNQITLLLLRKFLLFQVILILHFCVSVSDLRFSILEGFWIVAFFLSFHQGLNQITLLLLRKFLLFQVILILHFCVSVSDLRFSILEGFWIVEFEFCRNDSLVKANLV
jgi:hypothetical protein